jgi:hypothetical protein
VAKWINRVVKYETKKELAVILAAEGDAGYEFVQAWTDPIKQETVLIFRKPQDATP